MSTPADPSPTNDADDDLQFEVAEPTTVAPGSAAETSPARCAGCGRALGDTYYAVGQKMACAVCVAKIHAKPARGRPKRLGKAIREGLVAAVLGAIIWYAIRKFTGLEIGYVAILVGFMVGKAVLRGSDNRGGRAYQILAVVLTYASITSTYVPYILTGIENGAQHQRTTTAHRSSPPTTPADSSPSAFDLIAAHPILAWAVIRIALEAPFLGGAKNVIGLLIIGFALWQAWKMNRSRQLPISGPYQIGQPPAGVVV